MKISVEVIKSEEKYLSVIEAFFKEKWGATKLWSHDLSHHKRVWNYAKELLQYIGDADQLFIEKLLIACYLHDIGMAIDKGEKHGIQSRKICESFLEENKISPAHYADLIQAIEYHDNKIILTHLLTTNCFSCFQLLMILMHSAIQGSFATLIFISKGMYQLLTLAEWS